MAVTGRQIAAGKIPKQNAVLALQALQGSRGVYSEAGHVLLVRISRIETDNWGAHFSLDVVPAPGFEQSPSITLTVTARWDALWMSGRAVYAPDIAWLLLTGPDFVEEIAAAATQGQTGVALAGHIYALASRVHYQQVEANAKNLHDV